MTDGRGTWRCRWLGHRLRLWTPNWRNEYPWSWPPDMWLPDHGGMSGVKERLVCGRCERQYLFVHGPSTPQNHATGRFSDFPPTHTQETT